VALHHEPDRQLRRREARLAAALQDKNPGPDARAAFEALNKAHRELKDPGSRVSKPRVCMLRCTSSLTFTQVQAYHACMWRARRGAALLHM
jgi:hypothetical protein